MAIQMIRGNPAIASFNAGMDRGNAERRQETEDFRSRYAFEQAQGADKAMRAGFSAPYNEQPPTTITAPAASPAIAQFSAAPSAPSMPPATRPAMGASGMEAPNAGEAEARAAMSRPAAPVAAPSASSATPAAAPASRGFAGSRYAPIMRELAKTPGTGQAMMSMFSHDLQGQQQAATLSRQQEHDGLMAMSQALGKGDVRMGRMIADKYGLSAGIPEDFWKSREAMANFAIAGSLASKFEPEQRASFMQAYGKAAASGMSPEQAVQAATQAVGQSGGRMAAHYISDSGEFVGVDRQARRVGGDAGKPLPKARSPHAGAGGRASATVQNRRDAEATLKSNGFEPNVAAMIALNPRMMITPDIILRQANAIQKQAGKDIMGNPTMTIEQATQKAKALIEGVRAGMSANNEAGGGAQPAAADPGSTSVRPPLNSFIRGPAAQEPDDTEGQ